MIAFPSSLKKLYGEDIDADSGNNHLYHALASIAMLVFTHSRRPELDDRYKYEDS